MTSIQHNGTMIIIDEESVEDDNIDIYKLLIKKCLDFYKKVTPTVILVKDSTSDASDNILGLTVKEINGFVLFHNNIKRTTKRYAAKVTPKTTLIHCIVDTCFHELHHTQSYAYDPQWVLNHREEEEIFANRVAGELCIDFFKTQDIPIEVKPYVFKNEKVILTSLREYFNILLNEDKKWGPLSDYTDNVVTPEVIVTTPDTTTKFTNGNSISSADAKILYLTCFNQLKDSIHSPENILTKITIPPIVNSAYSMNIHGLISKTQISTKISGIINKCTKTPLYVFELKDGKQRNIEYDQQNDIGYVINSQNNEKILMYKNNTLSIWPTL